MITKLRLRNYRNHADTEIPLSPLTCFIGPAGGGKSNVFKGLSLLCNTLRYLPSELFPPGSSHEFRSVRSRWANTTDSIELGVDLEGLPRFPGQRAAYRIEFAEGPEGIYVANERLACAWPEDRSHPAATVFDRGLRGGALGAFGTFGPYDGSVLRSVLARPATDAEPPEVQFAAAAADALWRALQFHLQVPALLQPSDTNQPATGWLGLHGENLPGLLSYLRNDPSRADSFERIEQQLRELLPARLGRIMLAPMAKDQLGIWLSFEGYTSAIASADLSDGTMLTLGLLAVTELPFASSLLAVEEPETGINPRRLKWLFERLADLACREGGHPVQVLLSTHAPYLLDFFRDTPEAVCIIDAPDGRARVRTLETVLAQNPELPDDVSLGTQWYMGFYEGWNE